MSDDSRLVNQEVRRADAYDSILRWSLAATVGVAGSCLLLLVSGIFTAWLALAVATPLTYVASRLLPAGGRRWSVASVIAIGICVGSVLLSGSSPHEHVLGGRDGGTYTLTAAWAARSGDLLIPSGIDVFGEPDLRYGSMGFAESQDRRRVYPQFMHLFPGLLALGMALGGSSVMLWVTPIVGGIALLAFFGVARRFVPEWIALLAVVAVALALPFSYFTRAPFSEPLAMLFLFGGLWALTGPSPGNEKLHAIGAGLLMGGVFAARLDGVMVFLGLAVYLTWCELVSESDPLTEALRHTWSAAAIVSILALTEAIVFSPQYIASHAEVVGPALAATLTVRLLGRLGHSRAGKWLTSNRNRLAAVVVGASGAWLVYAWTLRPSFEAPTRRSNYGITDLQIAAGVPAEPLRSYAELSLHWLSWYLGPVLLAFGLVGLLFLVHLFIRRVHRFGVFASILFVSSMTYLVRPSINPDHIWAMRRFVPVVLPGLVLAGSWLGWQVAAKVRNGSVVLAVVGVLACVPIGMTTGRVGTGAEFSGAAEATTAACGSLGEDAAALFVASGEGFADIFMPMFRNWCGVPVAAEIPSQPLSADEMGELVDRVTADGRTLWVFSDESVGRGAADRSELALYDVRFEFLESTLFHPPTGWLSIDVDVGVRSADQ